MSAFGGVSIGADFHLSVASRLRGTNLVKSDRLAAICDLDSESEVPVSKFDFRNIEKFSGQNGERAVVGGTTIPVQSILNWYAQGMSVDEIVRAHVELRLSDVHDALAYAYDHLEEIHRVSSSDEPGEADPRVVDLRSRGISEHEAADLRRRLQTIADDWERPEMDAYDAL